MIKSILMDVDDTLLDFSRSEALALAETLEKHSLPPQAGEVYRDINQDYWRLFEAGGITKEALLVRRFEDLFARYGLERDCAAVNREYLETLGGYAFLLPGAEELCRELHGKYTLGIATNGTRLAQESRMRISGLDRYFSHCFISEVIGSQKPSKGFFDAVLAALGHPDPRTVIILGDSLTSDMRGGRSAGIHTCWYNPGGLEPTADCDFAIRDLADFPGIINTLNSKGTCE